MIDHKQVLRDLAEKDGCQASLKAAAHIEYLERRLANSVEKVRHLQQKLHHARSQRNALRRLTLEGNNGING